MKKLFIYYSCTGNGDVVANYLNDKGYDIRKVIRKKKMPKTFFFRVFVGGFLAMTKKKDKLVDFDSNIADYDEIVIGSPTWCSTISSPINTVLAKLNFEGKKVDFILYSASGESPTAVERITNEYKEAKIVCIKEPLKDEKELEKLDVLLHE